MKRSIPLMLLVATSATSIAHEPPSKPKSDTPVAERSEAWTMFGRDLQNTNHYPQVTGSSYKKVWSVRAGCPAPGMSSTIVDGRAMYNTSPCSSTGDTHAVGLDGKKLWSHGVGQGKRGIISTPCIHEGTLYCVDNGFIKALGTKDGDLKWKQEVTCGKVSLSAPIAYEGKLYLNGTEGVQILLLDRSKSAEDKVIPIEGGHGATTPAFYKGTMILLSLQHVHSFDTQTLELNWKVELPMGLKERLINSPVIDARNGRIFVVSSMPYDPKGQLRCLKLAGGGQIWQQDTRGTSMRPSISFDGSRVYLACMDGSVAAYDPASGEALWEWSLPGEPLTAEGKPDHGRQLGGLISTRNKLVFCNRDSMFIISNDKPEGIDCEIDLGGFGSPTPAFHDNDLFFRCRTREEGARNYRYTEVKEQSASDIEVSIIAGKAHIRNLTRSKLSFYQFCYGINVNEKQNCVLWEFELKAGEETELDLGRFVPVDGTVDHLLLCLEYESPGGTGEFRRYFELGADE